MSKFSFNKLFFINIFIFSLIIWISKSQAQWTQTNEPSHTDVDALLNSGNYLFAGLGDGSMNGGGVYLSTNNGSTWSAESNGLNEAAYGSDTMDVYSICTIGNRIITGTYYGGTFLSDNYGQSWTQSFQGLTNSNGQPLGVIAFAVKDTNVFAASTSGGVYVSGNQGNSWTAVQSPLNSFGSPTEISAFAVKGTILFASSFANGIFKTTDNGNKWITDNTGLPTTGGNITTIYGLAAKGTFLFCATAQGVYRSSDNDSSWSPVVEDTSAICITATNAGVFAGTYSDGVLFSADSGNTWTAINKGLNGPALNVSAITVSGNYLIAGTGSDGIWRRPLSDLVTSVNTNKDNFPVTFKLDQNYPNPFNPSTIISYALPESGIVTLNIYNLLGQKIQTLIDERQNAGTHNFTFNASNLASGVYIYVLNSGSFTAAKKLILLK